MTEFTEEQLKRLPYHDMDATGIDVAKEIQDLCAMVAMVVNTDPRNGAQVLLDGKNEPGTSVLIQRTRLTLALESWLAGTVKNLVGIMSPELDKAMNEGLTKLLTNLSDQGYLHKHTKVEGSDL